MALGVGLLAVMAGLARAEDPDPRPSSFFGTVRAGGEGVPAGTRVSAAIDGTTFAESAVFVEEGESRFRLDVPADVAATAAVEGGVPGAAIAFAVGGRTTPESATWADGTYVRLDLTAAVGPDLSVEIDDGVAVVSRGEALTYEVGVTNGGAVPATGVVLEVGLAPYLELVAASDGGVLDAGVVRWPAASVAAGESLSRRVTARLKPAAPLGVTSVVTEARVGDDRSQGFDPTPADNAARDADAVTPPPGALPDLAIGFDNVVIDPLPSSAGEVVEVAVTVRNAGLGSASPVPVEVRAIDAGGSSTVLLQQVLAEIPPAGNRRLSFPWTAPGGVVRLVAEADPSATLLEISRSNNRAEREVTVPRAAGPDLTVTIADRSSLLASPTSSLLQGPLQLEVTNLGDAAAPAPFRVVVFEDGDGDGVRGAGEAELGSAVVVDDLAAGSSLALEVFVSGSVAFFHPLAWAVVDADGAVAERDESNNRSALFGDCPLPAVAPSLAPLVEWRVAEVDVESSPLVVQLDDDNGDGAVDSRDVPDVVVLAEDAEGILVLAASGLDGRRLWSFRSSSEHPLPLEAANLAAADLDGDAEVEIVVPLSNGRLLALDRRGAPRWVSDAVEGVSFRWVGSIAIGDLDADGVPEIAVGRTVLSNDGRLLATGSRNRATNVNLFGPFGVVLTPGASDYPHTVIADVDLDGRNELVAGDALYRLEGGGLVVVWDHQESDGLMEDGFAAVANLDADPEAEIVYVSSGQILTLNHDGSVASPRRLITPLVPGVLPTFWGSAPTVADLDGDGNPEILVAGATEVVAFSAGLGVRWRAPIDPDFGSITGITAFDLDGDGRREALFAGESNLYVFDGTSGAVVHSRRNLSKTATEFPVVADVDGDGRAEILLGSNTFFDGDPSTRGLYALGDPGWAGTLPLWNQYGFHVTNALLDGTVPVAEAPSWLGENTFRVNRQLPPPQAFLPNLTVSLPRIGAPSPTGVPITLRLGNGGRGAVGPGAVLRLFAGDVAGGDVALETTLDFGLRPGTFRDVTVSWTRPLGGGQAVSAVIDGDGAVAECLEDDNRVDFTVAAVQLADLEIAAGGVVAPATAAAGQRLEVGVTVRNAGPASSPPSTLRVAPLGAGQSASEVALPALAAGEEAPVTVAWDSRGLDPGVTILEAVADPFSLVVEGDESNNAGLAVVELLAPSQPDLAVEELAVQPPAATAGDPVVAGALVVNRGADLVQGSEVVWRRNGAEVARSPVPPLPAGGSHAVSQAFDTVGLAGLVVLEGEVDPEGLVAEGDESNNRASVTASVSAAPVSLTVVTDRLSYDVESEVGIAVAIRNDGAPATFELRVDVLDAAGAPVAAVAAESRTLASGVTDVALGWNTALEAAGVYSVVAELRAGEVVRARGSTAFDLAPELRAQAMLFNDRDVYGPQDEALLSGDVANRSRNADLRELRARVEVVAEGGEVAFVSETAIDLLPLGGSLPIAVRWPIANAAPGRYSAGLSLRDRTDRLLAFDATAPFVVTSSAETGEGLSGSLEASPAVAGIGAPVDVAFSATNGGNADMPQLGLRVELVRRRDAAVVASRRVAAPLARGASFDGVVGFASAGLEPGEHHAQLIAELPGRELQLGLAPFTVVPAISIADAALAEGDAGTATMRFDVTLAPALEAPASVSYATRDATAQAGLDYAATSGVLSFAPGATRATIEVAITGDLEPEGEEVFLLVLSSPTGAVLGDAQAVGRITDEEGCVSFNLLRDGDGEEGSIGPSPSAWRPIGSGWRRRAGDPPPLAGEAFLAHRGAAGEVAELVQEIDLGPFAAAIDGGEQRFRFTGFVQVSEDAAASTARVVVEYAGAAGGVLEIFDGGEVAAVGDWLSLADERAVPVGTRTARVRLVARHDGAGTVGFDRLSLAAVGTPVVTLGDVEVNEGDAGITPAPVGVSLSCPLASPLVLELVTADESATAGSDYRPAGGLLTVAAGETAGVFVVEVLGDGIDEADEELVVVADAGPEVALLRPAARVRIADDDGPAAIAAGEALAVEGDGAVRFAVTLPAPSGKTVSVAYATADGTARAGSDYQAVSGRLTFPPGTVEQSVDVPLIDDAVGEGEEGFSLLLSEPVNGILGDAEGQARIADDDEVLVAVDDVVVLEGDDASGSAVFTVSLSLASDLEVTVAFATADLEAVAGADYAPASGVLTFAPGSRQATVAVSLAGDLVVEPREAFRLVLSDPANALLGDPEGVATIIDDDGNLVSVGDLELLENQGGNLALNPGTTVTASSTFPGFPATRAIDGDLNTSWFTACGDAANLGTSPFIEITLAAEAEVREVKIFGNRQFASGFDFFAGVVQLFDAAGALLFDSGELELPAPVRDLTVPVPAVAGVRRVRFTATDDQSCEPGLAEIEVKGGADVAVPILLAKPADGDLVVSFETADGTALAGADYAAAAGTVTIPAGAVRGEARVTIFDDALAEPIESFFLRLTAVDGGLIFDGEGEVRLLDDDGWVLLGDAVADAANECFTLTPDEPDRVGAMWFPRRVDLSQSFDQTYRVFLGERESGGTGLTYMLQGEASPSNFGGLDVVGQPGDGGGLNGARAGHAVSLELDTWTFSSAADHLGVGSFTNQSHNLFPAVPFDGPGENLEDGREHELRVVWNAATTSLTALIDGREQLTMQRDLIGDGFLLRNDVIYGFLASTGTVREDSVSNRHVVCPAAPCDDPSTPPRISVGPARLIEGDGGSSEALVPVTLSCPREQAVSVAFATADDSAVAGEDYLPRAQTVVIPAGRSGVEVPVTVLGDLEVEDDEQFSVVLSEPQGAVLGHRTAAVTIETDDMPIRLRFPSTVVEDTQVGGRFAQDSFFDLAIEIELPRPAITPIEVRIGTRDGSATGGSDYSFTSHVLRFDPGVQRRRAFVRLSRDGLAESDETFFITLSDVVGNAAVVEPELEVTILDDDVCPSPNLLQNPQPEGEVGGELAGWTEVVGDFWTRGTFLGGVVDGDYFFAPSDPLAELQQEVDVSSFASRIDAGVQRFAFLGFVRSSPIGTHTPGPLLDDAGRIVLEYLDGAGTVLAQVDGGEMHKQLLSYQPVTDRRLAPPGTRTLRVRLLSRIRNATAIGGTHFDGLVLRALDLPVVSAGDVTVVEGQVGESQALFPISLTCPSPVPVAVRYLTRDGSAFAGSDYRTTSGRLVIPAGATSATIAVPVLGDGRSEGDETFSLHLFDPQDAGLAQAVGVATIADDEVKISIADAAVVEGDAGSVEVLVPVSLSAASPLPIQVDYATAVDPAASAPASAGSDFEPAAGTVFFAPGETESAIAVAVLGDLESENDETFKVVLGTALNGAVERNEAVVTILQDDSLLTVANATVVEGNAGSTDAVFTLELEAPASNPVSVAYRTADDTATAGSDYEPRSGTVTLAPGQTTASIAVPVLGDRQVEPGETFFLRLSQPQNAALSRTEATAFIVDDDDCPSPELLQNGGAELTDAGELTGWTEVAIDWTQGRSNPAPFTGEAYFAPFGTGSSGELVQEVDVSRLASFIDRGSQRFAFGAAVRSAVEVQPDAARVIVEYRDADGVVLASFDSGEIASTDAWRPVSDLRPAPPATRAVRVRLLAINRGGFNRAYFDAVSLRTLGTPVVFGLSESVLEGDDGSRDLSFTLHLSCAADQEVAVAYRTVDDGAIAGEDYLPVDAVARFAAGETETQVTVTVLGNRILEADDRFLLELSSSPNAAVLDPLPAGSIVNDDPPPSLLVIPATVEEGASGELTEAVIGVRLSAPSELPARVHWRTIAGSATIGDFQFASGELEIPPFERQASLSFTVIGDDQPEEDEIFSLQWLNLENVLIGGGSFVEIVQIVNDDSDACRGVNLLANGRGESIDASGQPSDWMVSAGTWSRRVNQPPPFEGGAYLAEEGTTALAELVQEVDLSAYARFVSAGMRLRLRGAVRVSSLASARAASGRLIVEFRRRADQTVLSTFDSGAKTSTGWAVVNQDLAVPAETGSVRLRLVVERGSGTAARGVYFDNLELRTLDVPTLTVGAIHFDPLKVSTLDVPTLGGEDLFAAESDGSLVFALRLSCALQETLSVPFATVGGTALAGEDFVATSGVVTFQPGQVRQGVTVPILDDDAVDPEESFTLALDGSVLPPNVFLAHPEPRGFILDDDAVSLDLMLCIDGTNGGEEIHHFQAAGTALAIEDPTIVPHNSTVRLGVLSFGFGTVMEIPPTILDRNHAERVAAKIRALPFRNSFGIEPSEPFCLRAASGALAALAPPSLKQVVDISLRRSSSVDQARQVRDLAVKAGVDVINVLSVTSPSNAAFELVYPQPPGGPEGFVDVVQDLEDYAQAIGAKIEREASPDLTVTLTASPTPAVPGDTLAYTAVITNQGAAPVRELLFPELPLAGLAGPAFSPSVGTLDPVSGRWTGIDLGLGSSLTLTIAGKVDPVLTGSLAATISVLPPAGTSDLAPEDNDALLVTPLAPRADLGIAKSAASPELEVGGVGRFLLEVTNAGPSDASGPITVRDPLPAGLGFNGATGEGWLCASEAGVVTCTHPGPAAAGSALPALEIDVAVAAGAVPEVTNAATVEGATPDPNPANDASSVTLAVIETTPQISATMRDLLVADRDGDGVASPGDVVGYRVEIANAGGRATGVAFRALVPPHAALVAGSVSTTAGSITSEDGVEVAIGLLDGGTSVSIAFDVEVVNPLPAGVDRLVAQGTVTSAEVPAVLSDDPDLGGASDATETVLVASPLLVAEKTAVLAEDADGDGVASPGDVLEYAVRIKNNGNAAATGVALEDAIPAHGALVAGSLASDRGTVTEGDPLRVAIGELAGGMDAATVSFRVRVENPIAAGVMDVSNQGVVRSNELPELLTDDPAVPGAADPTVTMIRAEPRLVASKVALLFADAASDGEASPGDEVLYRLTLDNRGNTAATGVVLRDELPLGASLVAGTVQSSQGVITGEDPLVVELGAVAVGVPVTISFRVAIDEPFPATALGLSNQAVASAVEVDEVRSDDPSVPGPSDPTATPVFIRPQVTLGDATVVEGDPPAAIEALIPITLSEPSNRPVRVAFATAGGTASAGADFAAATGEVEIPPGEVSGAIAVAILPDLLDEPEESFRVVLSGAAGGVIAGGEAQVVIADDDEPPQISIAGARIVEGDAGTTEAVFPVTLSAASGFTVAVDYGPATGVAGSAAAGADYQPVAGRLEIPPGEVSGAILVAVAGDLLDEPEESFFLELLAPENAVLGTSVAEGVIADDDQPPQLAVSVAPVSEGPGASATFAVTLSAASGFDVSVAYATADASAIAGLDYAAVSGRLVLPAGSTEATVSVPLLDDALDEAEETFELVVSDAEHAVPPAQPGRATIVDDDPPPSISIADLAIVEGTGGTVEAQLLLTLSSASGRDVAIGYRTADGSAVAGSDYAAASGTVVLGAGTTSATLAVALIGDRIDEPEESFRVVLQDPVHLDVGRGEAQVTIVDDDAPPSLSIGDVTVIEGDAGRVEAVFPLTLSLDSGFAVSLAYATADGVAPARPATAGEDYEAASGTVVIPPGAVAATVRVSVLGDLVDELDEVFTLVLSDPQHVELVDGEGVATISDDDEALLAIDDVAVEEGDPPAVTDAIFTVSLSLPSDREVRVSYATAAESAAAGRDFLAAAGSLSLAAGTTRASVVVSVVGDRVFEPAETFRVELSAPEEAALADAEGRGTILDDEICPGVNLIANPGAELLPVAGEIPFWSEVEGTDWRLRFLDPEPQAGSAYFWPGVAELAELVQDVDVSAYAQRIDAGGQRFLFEGFIRVADELPPDLARIVVEYRDASNTVPLEVWESPAPARADAWTRVEDQRAAPAGTRFIRIRLLSTAVDLGPPPAGG
ncbi:MAG: DUF11 domain-containing protein, partial [Acidobacteria bacterium]